MTTRIPGAIARPPTKPPLALLIRLRDLPEPPIVFVEMDAVADRVVKVEDWA